MKSSRFIFIYLILILTGLYINMHSDIEVPVNRPLVEFPTENSGWKMTSQSSFSENILKILKPSDYLVRRYAGPDNAVAELYIGYHSGAKGIGQVHSPKQCLPGGGWNRLKEDKVAVDVPGGKVNLVRAVYQKGDSKELFLYWYKVKGKTLDDEYSLKLSQITNSILYRRKDAAFVRISVPFETEEKAAFDGAVKFVQAFAPAVDEFLP